MDSESRDKLIMYIVIMAICVICICIHCILGLQETIQNREIENLNNQMNEIGYENT